MFLALIMIQFIMKCIYCNNLKLYKLKTNQLKCSACNRKFSLQKILKQKNIIKSFINNKSINQTKNQLNLNYETVKKTYDKLRYEISIYLENNYLQDKVSQYDEYVYLEKSKLSNKKNIFDAHNFMTFQYENKVYNLLMPSLSRYKEQFINDGSYEIYYNEFKQFMRFNKISKIKKQESLIVDFWQFFEDNITIYKGISNEKFFYYLKEFEFKFNYSSTEQEDILFKLLLN